MKKRAILKTFFFALVAVGLLAPNAAQANSSLMFGQNQSYSAVVRPDGNVITYGKIYLENTGENELKSTKFTAPDGVKLNGLEVYQITLPERCENIVPSEEPDQTKTRQYPIRYEPDCGTLEAQLFGYNEYYYAYYDRTDSGIRYQKLEPKQDDQTYTVELSKPLKPKTRGAILVAYSTKDYTKGMFGSYSLEFKTLKVDMAVENVRVAVDVSNDLYTKAGKSKISSDKSGSISDGIKLNASSAKGVESSNLDSLQSQIGQGGTFNKTGKGLIANETFVVKGSFADAQWKLYFWEIVGGIVAILLLVALSVFLLRKADRPSTKTKSSKLERN